MRRALIQFVLVLLLGVWLGGPVLENVDPWDIFPDTGDNIILVLTAATACLGAILCLAFLIARMLEPAGAACALPARAPLPESHPVLPPHSAWFESPQPLRI